MNPLEYIKSIYTKDGSIRYVSEQWVGLYLNKALLQDRDNIDAIEKAVEYSLYISPTHYFYLLYMLVPKKMNYYIRPVRKVKEEDEADELVDKVKYILGYSEKEYRLNRRQIEATILLNREYWNKELGVEHELSKRKRK